MCPEHIKELVIGGGESKSPIFYTHIEYDIITVRGKTRKRAKFTAKKIVVKGSLEEIKKSKRVKASVLKFHFQGSANVQKKIKDFDFDKIELTKVIFLKFLSYGVK